MITYWIVGAKRETGKDIQVKVSAKNKKQAIAQANDLGILVARAFPAQRNSNAPFGHFSLHTKIAGISRQNNDGTDRQLVARMCRVGDRLTLLPDPKNTHDEFAVKVCVESGEQLGYIKSDIAPPIHVMIRDGHRAYAVVTAITGDSAEKPTVGMNIEVIYPVEAQEIMDSG
jgi:hypothetical protein